MKEEKKGKVEERMDRVMNGKSKGGDVHRHTQILLYDDDGSLKSDDCVHVT